MADPANVPADSLRIPPHSIEAEQSILGGLMLSPEAWDRVVDRIRGDDFYRHDHRLIYQAIADLAARNQPCDAITVSERLQGLGKVDEAGGAAYLVQLANGTPSAANILAYADIVREKSILRQLIDCGTNIANDGYRPEGRASRDLLESAEQRVFAIAEVGARGRQGFVSMREAAKDAFRILQERFESDGDITGVPTGFADFDAMTTGLQPADLVIVAARPSMGKTAFALNIAEWAALRTGKGVGVFSMEMSVTQLAFRLLSSLSRIDQQKLRTGDLDDMDWDRLNSAVAQLAQMPLYVDDTPALSPAELRARARRLKRESDLSMIVVDYLQLMQVPGNKENRTTEISEISRSLKALAKELNVPVVALSQLNRSLEQRADKRPMMSDLRESGAIEQDADLIVFIYRDEYYNPESADKGLAEIIIGKQRNGPTGVCKLTFLGRYTRFENYAPDSFIGDFE